MCQNTQGGIITETKLFQCTIAQDGPTSYFPHSHLKRHRMQLKVANPGGNA
jgi:hypothetical protein